MTLRLTPEIGKAMDLWREHYGPASDQEVLSQLLCSAVKDLESEIALDKIARERHEAFDREERERYGPPPTDEEMAAISDEEWDQMWDDMFRAMGRDYPPYVRPR